MSSSKIARRLALSASLLAMFGAAVPMASQAAGKTKSSPKTKVSTGRATHVLATSALLTAVITPEGVDTSYYFQYGPTTAYGSQTPTVGIGSGDSKVKVGQSISGLQSGVLYHFRAVALTPGGLIPGADHSFTAGGKKATGLQLPKSGEVVAGTPFVVSGTFAGPGGANHAVILQASTYPYREAFKTISTPVLTSAAGHFSFPIAGILTSTEYRVSTLDTRPLYSRIELVRAAVKVVLHVRVSKLPGLVRLYGTVSPAAVGVPVSFEVHTSVKPGLGKPGAEEKAKFVSQFATVVRKAGKTYSRFSLIVSVRIGGRYRAAVKLPRTSPLVSGYSPTLVLRAAPGKAGKGKKAKKG